MAKSKGKTKEETVIDVDEIDEIRKSTGRPNKEIEVERKYEPIVQKRRKSNAGQHDHKFEKGKSGNPSGRPKGSKSKEARVLRDWLSEGVMISDKLEHPLNVLLCLANGYLRPGVLPRGKNGIPIEIRLKSAIALLPYMANTLEDNVKTDMIQREVGEVNINIHTIPAKNDLAEKVINAIEEKEEGDEVLDIENLEVIK